MTTTRACVGEWILTCMMMMGVLLSPLQKRRRRRCVCSPKTGIQIKPHKHIINIVIMIVKVLDTGASLFAYRGRGGQRQRHHHPLLTLCILHNSVFFFSIFISILNLKKTRMSMKANRHRRVKTDPLVVMVQLGMGTCRHTGTQTHKHTHTHNEMV